MPSSKKSPLVGLGLAVAAVLTALATVEVYLRATGFSFRLYPETIEFG